MYSEALWKTNSTKMMGALALESGNIVLVSQQFLNTFYVHNAVLETWSWPSPFVACDLFLNPVHGTATILWSPARFDSQSFQVG